MQRYKRAEVTVFLSLLCLVLCSFLGVIIKSARKEAIRRRIEIVTDVAVRSAFSEYDKALFDDYDILCVDTTYKGSSEGGDSSFINHVSRYVEINLQNSEPYLGELMLVSVSLSDVSYLDEEDFSDQSIEFFKDNTYLSAANVTVYVQDSSGKVYECEKAFSLN